MISPSERKQIIEMVRRGVVPAIGCTEPICVALAVSRAAEALGTLPAHIEARLSANILKNAMGVGIPGTDMVGLPIAIALGAIAGRADYGLEVLRDCTAEDVEHGKRYIEENRIDIALKEDAPEKLYVDIKCHADNGATAQVIIAREHTHYIYIARNGEILLDAPLASGNHAGEKTDTTPSLTLRLTKSVSSMRPADLTKPPRPARSKATTATVWAKP